MSRLKVIAATLATAGVAMAGMGTAQASAHTYQPGVACWWGYGGSWGIEHKVRPKACMFNGDEAHAYTTTIKRMTWGSWGGKTACGHGVLRYNAGYRTRVSFCLYKLDDVEGYLRIRGRTSTRGCAYGMSGKYECFTQPARRFDNSTA